MALKYRLFHLYALLRRPMTLGVRMVVWDQKAQTIFLVRHTYVNGWHLPGGGVERGETLAQAVKKELLEEGNIELTSQPQLFAMYKNRQVTNRDHVALYICTGFRQIEPRLPDYEIAEAGFFPLGALPEATTASTRKRLAEVVGSHDPEEYW